MKKILFFLLAAGICLNVSSAFAYTINDAVPDRIGGLPFELYGIDVTQTDSQLIFDIYTNFPKTGHTVGTWDTFPADLAIDVEGDKYGVAFSIEEGLEKGSLYGNPDWYVSDHYAPVSGNYTWNHDQIVTMYNGTLLTSGSVTWNLLNSTSPDDPNYKITVPISLCALLPAGFDGNIGIFYGGATCANDFISGSVHVTTPIPEPATMFLLGSGLLGMAAFGRAKRKRS